MAVALNTVGSDAKIEMEVRVNGEADWAATSTDTQTGKALTYTSTTGKFIELGESFTGIVHSLEITTSTEPLAIDKAAINGSQT